jgi:hypothetical protein
VRVSICLRLSLISEIVEIFHRDFNLILLLCPRQLTMKLIIAAAVATAVEAVNEENMNADE